MSPEPPVAEPDRDGQRHLAARPPPASPATDLTDRLTTDLRMALDADAITPYAQPLIDLATGEPSAVEILARWTHPTLGIVPPGLFIPLAARVGLIDRLTAQLLRRAGPAVATWPDHLQLSVNITPHQLLDPEFPKTLHAATGQAGISPHRLILELAEFAGSDNLDAPLDIAHELKSVGAQLALDDFGTGFSSLLHLQALPFDRLKVDASLVRSIATHPPSRKIVAAVIGLGQSLGLTTVAQGIEDQRQLDLLKSLGCDLGQGDLLGPPVPIKDILAGLLAGRWSRPSLARRTATAADLAPLGKAPPSLRLAQLQAIYDSVPVGLAIFDRDLRYVSVNRRLAEMQKRPMSDYPGQLLEELLPEVYRAVQGDLRRAMAGDATLETENWRPATEPGGRDHYYLISYQPVRDDADEVIGVTAAIIDITERKSAEEALQRAEKLSLIGQLTGGIAHDLNNLLTVIMLNLETVESGMRPADPLGEMVKAASAAARTGAQLIGQLLSFASRKTLRPQPLNIDAVLGAFATLARRMLGERFSLVLRPPDATDLAPGSPPRIVHVDPAQLESALLNLIVNARDAMPDGGRVTLSTAPHRAAAQPNASSDSLAEGDYITVVVTDEGAGMSPAILKRAIEPFFSTKPVGQGTGLGLSMVHGFARQSGGATTFESTPGKGTSVRLYLPISHDAALPAPPPPPPPVQPPARIATRTLLVEDQPDLRRIATQLGTSLGLDVTAVENADIALELLRADPSFALLITDVVMPGSMNGLGLAKAARALKPGLKVMYVSGYFDPVADPTIFVPGAELLAKPYTRAQFAATLRAVI